MVGTIPHGYLIPRAWRSFGTRGPWPFVPWPTCASPNLLSACRCASHGWWMPGICSGKRWQKWLREMMGVKNAVLNGLQSLFWDRSCWIIIYIRIRCLGLTWEIWEDKHVDTIDFYWVTWPLYHPRGQRKALIDWGWYLSIWMVHVWLLVIHLTPWRYHLLVPLFLIFGE